MAAASEKGISDNFCNTYNLQGIAKEMAESVLPDLLLDISEMVMLRLPPKPDMARDAQNIKISLGGAQLSLAEAFTRLESGKFKNAEAEFGAIAKALRQALRDEGGNFTLAEQLVRPHHAASMPHIPLPKAVRALWQTVRSLSGRIAATRPISAHDVHGMAREPGD